MGLLDRFLSRKSVTPSPEPEKRPDRNLPRILKEMKDISSWSRTVAFESGSVNVVAMSFSAPLGYAGGKVQVVLKSDGRMNARAVSFAMGEDIGFEVPDDMRSGLLSSFMNNVTSDNMIITDGKRPSQVLLDQARQKASHEFLLDQKNRSDPASGPRM